MRLGRSICAAALVLGSATATAAQERPAVLGWENDFHEIERTASRILVMHGELIRFGDPAAACVDDVLSEVDAALRIAEERVARREDALARGDAAEVARNERLIRGARNSTRRLRLRAARCVDPTAGEDGDARGDRTTVVTTIEPTVPGDEVFRGASPPRTVAEAFTAD